jgi:two-component system, OmpR family, sensor histidine kinase TctE
LINNPPISPARQPESLRRRIAVGALLLMVLMSTILTFLAWRNAQHAADEAFDRLLGASALSISDSIRVEDERMEVELPQAALAMLGIRSDARIFYRVANSAGELIAGSVTLGIGLPLAETVDPVFLNGDFRGEKVRLAITGRSFERGWANVVVAETLEARHLLRWQLFFPSIAALLMITLVALGVIWFGIKRAFRPLARIEDELRQRAPADLQPLAAKPPREVSHLVEALDDFMMRLQGTLDLVRSTASHAAHEVRTPIAAIRAQAAAALVEKNPKEIQARLRRIEANAETAGQIVNQIMADAFVQHRLGTKEAVRIDMLDLCHEVIDRLDPQFQPVVRLALEPGQASPCLVMGDAVAVREVIRNLVDNALKYAPDGLVEVNLGRRDAFWQIEVADCGPGIPVEDHEMVMNRFARGKDVQSVPGAGIGLDIVRQVAQTYGGTFALLNRKEGGLSATFRLRAVSSLVAIFGLVALLMLSVTPGLAQTAASPATSPQNRPVKNLMIMASPDSGLLQRLTDSFIEKHPDVRVQIQRVQPSLIPTTFRGNILSQTIPDLVISHVADLQVELVNDGLAAPVLAQNIKLLPDWAMWRRELVTFGLDHGTIIVRRSTMPEAELPGTRLDLARLLERLNPQFRGRVATYDIGNNSLALLLASQESRFSSSFWRLVRAMGASETRLFWTSDEIISALLNTEIDVAYNLLRADIAPLQNDGRFAVLPTKDYLLALPRTLFIPKKANAPGLANAFIDYTLSRDGQAIVAASGSLPILANAGGPSSNAALQNFHPVTLGPGLLAIRHTHTRSQFLETWLQLMLTR